MSWRAPDEVFYGPADFLAKSALTGKPNGGASNGGCRPFLRQKHRLRTFGNKVLRRVFEHKTEEVGEDGEGRIIRTVISCTLRLIFGSFSKGRGAEYMKDERKSETHNLSGSTLEEGTSWET